MNSVIAKKIVSQLNVAYSSLAHDVSINHGTENNKIYIYTSDPLKLKNGTTRKYIQFGLDSLEEVDRELSQVVGYKPVFKQNR